MTPRLKTIALDMSKMLLTKPRERKLNGKRMSLKRHHSGTVQFSTSHPSLSHQLWQRGQASTKNFARRKTIEPSLKQRRESFPERGIVRQMRQSVSKTPESLQRRPKLIGRPRRSVNEKRKSEGSVKRSWRRKNECVWRSKEKENRGNVLNVPDLHHQREERRVVGMSPHPVVAGEAADGEEVMEEVVEEGHHLTEVVVMAEVVMTAAIVVEEVAQ
mmetsp:Transcript_30644/g.48024  ORF Transcript_30644/g.48024 Transcript_30644/m.48024 type:complete len:216 (-) Transcript_30644:83-730(-)